MLDIVDLSFPILSSNLAACIHILGSWGRNYLALFNIALALEYVSNLAKANHISSLLGIHSVALCRSYLASYSVDNSINSFHSTSELGVYSNALFNTLDLMTLSDSLLAAANHILILYG